MRAALLIAPLLLAGCATTAVKETGVRDALVEAGVRRDTAQCMARPMAERLSVAQLRQLQEARRLAPGPVGQLTLGEVYAALSRTLDAETMAVITRAGLGCAIGG